MERPGLFRHRTWTPCGCCSAEPPIALVTHSVQEGKPCLHPNKASLQKSHEKHLKKSAPTGNGQWKIAQETWWNHMKPSYLQDLRFSQGIFGIFPAVPAVARSPTLVPPAARHRRWFRSFCVARRDAHRSRCCPGVIDAIAQYRYNRSPVLPFMICMSIYIYILSVYDVHIFTVFWTGFKSAWNAMWCNVMWCSRI